MLSHMVLRRIAATRRTLAPRQPPGRARGFGRREPPVKKLAHVTVLLDFGVISPYFALQDTSAKSYIENDALTFA